MLKLNSITELGVIKIFDNISVTTISDILNCEKVPKLNFEVNISNYSSGNWTLSFIGGLLQEGEYGDIFIPSDEIDTPWKQIAPITINQNVKRVAHFDWLPPFLKITATKIGSPGILNLNFSSLERLEI